MRALYQYFERAMETASPFCALLITIINYVLFPDQAFFTAFVAVGAAILLDIITKYIALSRLSGGLRAAVKTRKICSQTLWEGTRIKLISYLVVFILAGLSYRVTMLAEASVFLATVVYTVIFLRESQSVIENLCDAGADLNWLLIWTKKKQQQILDSDEIMGKGGDIIEQGNIFAPSGPTDEMPGINQEMQD